MQERHRHSKNIANAAAANPDSKPGEGISSSATPHSMHCPASPSAQHNQSHLRSECKTPPHGIPSPRITSERTSIPRLSHDKPNGYSYSVAHTSTMKSKKCGQQKVTGFARRATQIVKFKPNRKLHVADAVAPRIRRHGGTGGKTTTARSGPLRVARINAHGHQRWAPRRKCLQMVCHRVYFRAKICTHTGERRSTALLAACCRSRESLPTLERIGHRVIRQKLP